MASINRMKETVQIPRIPKLDYVTFMKEYRNQKPIIIPDIVSTWSSITKWTPEYLTDVLKLHYDDKLEVFVSKDNKHFINHPDVTKLVTMSAQEFASHVFQNSLEPDDDQTRYYLRTFSMPDILFCDVDRNQHVDILLSVLVSAEDRQEYKVNDNQERPHEAQHDQCDENKGDQKITYTDTNSDKQTDESMAAWEDFLSPVSLSDGDNDSGGELDDVKKQLSEEESVATNVGDVAKDNSDIHTRQTKFEEMYSRIFNPKTMQLWIGTHGNITPLHYDRNHGLLAQISGRKELVLFSHEDTPNLYPHPSYTDRAHTSRVDLRRMDENNYAQLFSKFQEAQPYTCILNPGELLYMPPFWWHDVTSLDNCVSVTLPWDIEGYEEVPTCMLR